MDQLIKFGRFRVSALADWL